MHGLQTTWLAGVATAAALVLMSGGGVQAQSSIGCFVPGECQGLYVAIAVRADPLACNDYCNNDVPTCQYWSHYNSSEACFAFLECDLDTTNCAQQGDCLSGDKGCQPFQCHEVGQCFGNTVGSPLVTLDGNECLQACKDVGVACNWYTWNSENNFCTLLADCSALDDTHIEYESGQRECDELPDPIDPTVVNKLLVIGGIGDNDAILDTVDAYDYSSNDLNCPAQKELPYGIESGVLLFEASKGAWMCGGRGKRDDQEPDPVALNECLELDATTSAWSVAGTMNAARFQAAGVMLNTESFVITGGQGSINQVLTTSDVWQAGQFETGPALLAPRSGHCIVQVDSNTLIIAGGIDDQGAPTRAAASFNTLNQEWTSLPNMDKPRQFHSCQIVESENQERGRELIVVGGGTGDALTTTEILKLEDNTWRNGPNFPVPIKQAASVAYGNTMKVLGGQDGGQDSTLYDTVYEYDVGFEIWRNDTTVPKLNRAARGLSAVMVDSNAITTCN